MSGSARWTAQDNSTFTFSPGDLYLGNDQLATKGHTTEVLGDEPCVLVMLQFPEELVGDHRKPCWFTPSEVFAR